MTTDNEDALVPVLVITPNDSGQPMLPLEWTPEQQELYADTYLAPVRELNAALADVLDAEAHPERTPAEALLIVQQAMEDFTARSEEWFDLRTRSRAAARA